MRTFLGTQLYYACGPAPMLRAAAAAADAANAKLYVSLEKHMACGVGACPRLHLPDGGGQKAHLQRRAGVRLPGGARWTVTPSPSRSDGVAAANPVIAASGTFGFGQ
jgi:NAD(P)H-flavin reductase